MRVSLLIIPCIGAVGPIAMSPRSLVAQAAVEIGPDSLTTAPNRIVLALPDSGGFLLNNTAIDSTLLEANLRAVFHPRPSKVLLLFPGPNPRNESLQWVTRIARGLGLTVFLANPAIEKGGLRAT